MGYALHVVEELPPPFQRVHEQTGLMPEGDSIRVVNPIRKMNFVLSGTFTHEIRGWSGERARILVHPGDIFVVPYLCEHHYIGSNPSGPTHMNVIRLAFDPEAFPALPLSGTNTKNPASPRDDSDEALIAHCLSDFYHLSGGQDEAIQEMIAHLRNEARLRLPGYRSRVYSLCLSLTILVARKVVAAPMRPAFTAPERTSADFHVARVKDYLLHHRRQEIHLERVAEHVQLSKEHLARLFKQSTGMTVFEYLRLARIELAKTELTVSDRNLSEIAHQTGFSSLTVFSRTFRHLVGVTPSQYRQQVAEQAV